MAHAGNRTPGDMLRDPEDEAADAFVGRQADDRTDAVRAGYEERVARDPLFADAGARVERAWRAIGLHAASPELMAYREQALARARRANARRWRAPDRRPQGRWLAAAAAAGIAVILAVALQLSPYGYRPGTYRTRVGEQRVVELADHSRIALDAATSLRVRYTDEARIVELVDGQAQFMVARDPRRPFRVEAGASTIVAVGTSFTVEYVDQEVHVALLEGRVVVNARPAAVASEPTAATKSKVATEGRGPVSTTELSPGEAMHVRADGEASVIPHADLEAATAWRQGKIVFHNELLGEAVRRLNRYSRLQLEVSDPRLEGMSLSGVFEVGDTIAFAEALQSYLPVTAEHVDSEVLRLRYQQQQPSE